MAIELQVSSVTRPCHQRAAGRQIYADAGTTARSGAGSGCGRSAGCR